jgi:hypothetical protein
MRPAFQRGVAHARLGRSFETVNRDGGNFMIKGVYLSCHDCSSFGECS